MRLTKLVCDRATYKGKPTKDGSFTRDVRWDDALPGFGLRIRPSGEKRFILSYRVGPQKKLYTIGAYGVLTLDQAREKALKLLAGVLDGRDPVAEKKAVRQAATVKDLCTAFLEMAKVHHKSHKEEKRRLEAHVIPAFGGTPATKLARAAVASLHRRIGGKHPHEANRVQEVLRQVYNWAREEDLIPAESSNPASGIVRFKEGKRDRFVQPDELPRLIESINKEPSPYVRAGLWLLLLTGARKSELLRTRWEDVDLAGARLTLRRTKNDEDYVVNLSSAAIGILEQVPREKDSPWVFPSPRHGQPLRWIHKNWLAAKKRAGLDDVRLHDLRRTLGSWLATGGASLVVIGKALGHKSLSATMRYAHLQKDVTADAVEVHGAKVLKLAGKHAAAALAPPKETHGQGAG